jgi:hypothetical protein
MKFKVGVSVDICISSNVCASLHELIAPPAAGLTATFELPTTLLWPTGKALGRNKLTTTVRHRGHTIVQQNHDVGPAILHKSVVTNFKDPVASIFSSRKVKFGSSTVRFNKAPAGATLLVALPPTPMFSCADPCALPSGSSVTTFFNSVECGISLAQYLATWAIAAIESASQVILEKAFRKPPTSAPPSSYGEAVKRALGRHFQPFTDPKNWAKGLRDDAPKNAIKWAVGQACGAIGSAATNSPLALTFSVKAAELNLSASIDLDGTRKASANAGVAQVSVAESEGKVQNTATAPVLHPFGD